MSEQNDDGIRIEVRPVPRTRAQGERQRRFGMALKTAVLILVAALVSVIGESWGLHHWPAEFVGAVCGLLAQQMLPPRLRWQTIGWIALAAGVLTGLLAYFKA